MTSLYLIERTDDWRDISWGNDIGLVVCVERKEDLQTIIETKLLRDNCGDQIFNAKEEPLTNMDIKTLYLGPADSSIKPGIILVSNAGS